MKSNHRHNHKKTPISTMLDQMVQDRGYKDHLLFVQYLIQREYDLFVRENRKNQIATSREKQLNEYAKIIDAKFDSFHKRETAWLESRIPMLMELIRPELLQLIDKQLR